jgi:phosphotransferase system enzyme I (PtsI)
MPATPAQDAASNRALSRRGLSMRNASEKTSSSRRVLRGTAVSQGVAQGTAYVVARVDGEVVPRRTLKAREVEGELARLEAALTKAEKDLVALRKSVGERIGTVEAEIFAAQALVVRDHALHDQVAAIVRDRHINVEAALAEVVKKFLRAFEEIPDPYLRERAADICDVGRRVFAALIADDGPDARGIPEGAILVADELSPSATARFELEGVKGFVTERGGKFSHASILARSMRMPAVTGVIEAALEIKTGDPLIVDGVAGAVFVDPDDATRREYDRIERHLRGDRTALQKMVDLPSVTRDGIAVALLANVSKLADTEAAFSYNADGIGLYRTEFLFAASSAFPSEEEQTQWLERSAARFHPRRVVLRLLDAGGDKELAYFPLPASRNPSLAQRGIRLLLKHPDVLERQLRAFLRVSAEHPVSILLPVVGGLEEVRATRGVLTRVMNDLRAEGVSFDPAIALGAMIEVPSAAVLAAALAKEVDFLSLGTNDLVQYVLAADREETSVADHYQPLHPAILRLISFVAGAAGSAGRPLSICGEMAGDPRYTELLLGLGLREFSVAPGELLEVKDAIRSVSLAEAKALAAEALEVGSVREVESLLARRREVRPRDPSARDRRDLGGD